MPNSEVIRDALRGRLERDRRLAALDTAVANGIADAEAGRVKPIDAVRSDLRTIAAVSTPIYLIFYRVGTQQIDVIHILNGAQDYEALLFPPT